MKTEIKWRTLDNLEATNTLKQHGFISDGDGNISLCGKIIHYNEEEMHACIDEIIDEGMRDKCCKLCLRKYKSIKNA